MKEYDLNKVEHKEFRDCLAPFGYALFILSLLTGLFLLREGNPPPKNSYSLRSDLVTFKSNLYYEIKDTTYEHEKTTHKNPLLDE